MFLLLTTDDRPYHTVFCSPCTHSPYSHTVEKLCNGVNWSPWDAYTKRYRFLQDFSTCRARPWHACSTGSWISFYLTKTLQKCIVFCMSIKKRQVSECIRPFLEWSLSNDNDFIWVYFFRLILRIIKFLFHLNQLTHSEDLKFLKNLRFISPLKIR